MELPRGGRTVFPAYRLVGYAGSPVSPALGRLGEGDLDERARELEKKAADYGRGRRVLPVLELITVIAHGRPGRDGSYSTRVDDQVIEKYLRTARHHRAILLLNIQPGRAEFLGEMKKLRRWLVQPDIGVALDPEWAVDAPDVPGQVYGHTTGRQLDRVAAYLSRLVVDHDLPTKVMVYHQLHAGIVDGEQDLDPHRGVAVVKVADGIGSRPMKRRAYAALIPGTPDRVHPGFKLFYTEDRRDGKLMTPDQVLALEPRPEYVLYE